MKTTFENLHEFVCPKCGGKHFGRNTAEINGTVQCLPTVRCHTPGCGWCGEWSSTTPAAPSMESAAKIMGLRIRPGEPDDLTIAQLIRQRADLLAALENIANRDQVGSGREAFDMCQQIAFAAIQSVKGKNENHQ